MIVFIRIHFLNISGGVYSDSTEKLVSEIAKKCGQPLNIQKSLSRHMLIHTNERSFTCDHCDTRFACKDCLSRHMLIHRNERSFTCDHCNTRFACKDCLSRHMLIHTNEKRFLCEYCGLQFTLLINFNRHIKNTCKVLRSIRMPYAEQINIRQNKIFNNHRLVAVKRLTKRPTKRQSVGSLIFSNEIMDASHTSSTHEKTSAILMAVLEDKVEIANINQNLKCDAECEI